MMMMMIITIITMTTCDVDDGDDFFIDSNMIAAMNDGGGLCLVCGSRGDRRLEYNGCKLRGAAVRLFSVPIKREVLVFNPFLLAHSSCKSPNLR